MPVPTVTIRLSPPVTYAFISKYTPVKSLTPALSVTTGLLALIICAVTLTVAIPR